MITSILTDVRIYKVNKSYYASAFYKILERYAKCFGKITLITRIIESESIPKGYNCIDDFCSELINVGSISHTFFSNDKSINERIKASNLVIIRLPSLIAMFLYKYVRRNKKIYLTEAMGCAWDAFWNHGLAGKLVAPYGFFKMKRIIRNADYAIYVTNSFLQNRYPCKRSNIGVSNVNITKIYPPKVYNDLQKNQFCFLTAAAVDVRYKGQQYVIRAIGKLKKRGVRCDYYLAGDGDGTYLRNIAKKNGVSDFIHFLGPLSHEELLKKMREIDFYIQPSLQEGLPRSVIEAMSCGCVCFGSNTAGIPELLDDDYIFKRRSSRSIVKMLLKKYTAIELNAISKRNNEISKNYLSDSLDKKRFAFYRKMKEEIDDKE